MYSNQAIGSLNELFPHPQLTRIHGEPDYDSLTLLADQLKANASAQYSPLGGGANGHIGLVLTPAGYLTVSLTAFVRPIHPGTLVIPPQTIQFLFNIIGSKTNITHKFFIRNYFSIGFQIRFHLF